MVDLVLSTVTATASSVQQPINATIAARNAAGTPLSANSTAQFSVVFVPPAPGLPITVPATRVPGDPSSGLYVASTLATVAGLWTVEAHVVSDGSGSGSAPAQLNSTTVQVAPAAPGTHKFALDFLDS